jgi:uncharacterized protein (TIGR02145 family)
MRTNLFSMFMFLLLWMGLGRGLLFAQGAEVCQGTAYTIASAVDASSASTYQWVEDGLVLTGASGPTYTVPSNKEAGIYTYIRQAKSADCSEWQSSNEFTVTVFDCSFTAGTTAGATATFVDPRDGKSYKTVVMPDGRTWFAQNLNYTKDLTYNAYSFEANGKKFTYDYPPRHGAPAIGSYWCPPLCWVNGASLATAPTYSDGPVESGSQADCRTYGALYTWDTAMMVDGKYSDDTKTITSFDRLLLRSYNHKIEGPPTTDNAGSHNNGKGTIVAHGGGRGICPLGWHIPTYLECMIMVDAVHGSPLFTVHPDGVGTLQTPAGSKLRSTATFDPNDTDPGTGAWLDLGVVANNETGFSAIPAGERHAQGFCFSRREQNAVYHTSSYWNDTNNYGWGLHPSFDGVTFSNVAPARAYSLRCIKD